MAKSKFFRVAVEGGTTDGRVIERAWLEQAAANYNPETYGARVNMEHIRGFSDEGSFKAYGDVLALRTETIDLELAGVTESRLALFAQVDATPELVSLNKRRQKLYSSVEIAPNFADTGEAYLVGLAVTDSPASLGTEMLAFAAGQGDASPLRGRKLDAANLFTVADELVLELEAEGAPTGTVDATGDQVGTLAALLAPIAAVFSRFTSSAPAVETPAPASAPEQPAPAVDTAAIVELGTLFANLSPAIEQLSTTVAALEAKVGPLEALSTSFAELDGKVTTLSTKLDGTPNGAPGRPLATGGNGNTRTDC